jgi:hypothetical protein
VLFKISPFIYENPYNYLLNDWRRFSVQRVNYKPKIEFGKIRKSLQKKKHLLILALFSQLVKYHRDLVFIFYFLINLINRKLHKQTFPFSYYYFWSDSLHFESIYLHHSFSSFRNFQRVLNIRHVNYIWKHVRLFFLSIAKIFNFVQCVFEQVK